MAATAMSTATSYFFGTRLTTNNPASYSDKFHVLLKFGTNKKAAPHPPPPKRALSNTTLSGEQLMWLPSAQPLEWLGRTMVGDRSSCRVFTISI
ncbi:hypothetical protein K1719_002491 [Acacia pycnantha]|nr:hypothetical protein K1719_002323 [Acacia pycnantha]KAI9126895.1 hypothetical protein K1719_002491 [Acacia pycnantha]